MTSSFNNPVLMYVRQYHAERQTMNNPKGWVHMLGVFEQATKGERWAGRFATQEQIEQAHKVVSRLARLERPTLEQKLLALAEDFEAESGALAARLAHYSHAMSEWNIGNVEGKAEAYQYAADRVRKLLKGVSQS